MSATHGGRDENTRDVIMHGFCSGPRGANFDRVVSCNIDMQQPKTPSRGLLGLLFFVAPRGRCYSKGSFNAPLSSQGSPLLLSLMLSSQEASLSFQCCYVFSHVFLYKTHTMARWGISLQEGVALE